MKGILLYYNEVRTVIVSDLCVVVYRFIRQVVERRQDQA